MLTQMSLINFKSWKQTGDIRLAPLTGFFGANSSGKSSLLQLLLMLKATTESSDRNVLLETNIKDYVELGTLWDIVNHTRNEVKISVKWDLDKAIQIDEIVIDNLNFSAYFIFPKKFTGVDMDGFVKDFSYSSNNLNVIIDSNDKTSQPYNYNFKVRINGVEPKVSSVSHHNNMMRPIKSYILPQSALNYYEDTPYLSELPFALEDQFARVYHLGPIRDKARRNYQWGGNKPSRVGIMGEDSIYTLLAGGDVMINKVAYWLKEMGLSASFVIKKVIGTTYQVELTHIGSDRAVLLPDMGFGVSQVLPVLVACYAIPEGSTLLIEQPEMHLHPSAQSVLADMFIEVMKERKVQLIIESHSEHLLARLQRRMAENGLDVQDTAFYFCQLRDGESHITTLEMDEYGEIKNYPDDFFGDLAGDVIKRTLSSIEQKIELAK